MKVALSWATRPRNDRSAEHRLGKVQNLFQPQAGLVPGAPLDRRPASARYFSTSTWIRFNSLSPRSINATLR